MKREDVRKVIHECIDDLNKPLPELVKPLKDHLLSTYHQRDEFDNSYQIKVEYDELYECINGSVERLDPIEKTRAVDKVIFSISSDKSITAKTGGVIVLSLDMDNLSKDDLTDIKSMDHVTTDVDIYRTFMRVHPSKRGILSNMLFNAVGSFKEDIPPYAFYKYEGEYFAKSGKMFGDLAPGGMGFGGFVMQKGNVLEIPSVVKSIGEHAFDSSKNLTKAYIPENVKYIGYHAFSNTPGLTIYCSSSSKPSNWDDEWCDKNCTVVWRK